MDAAVHRQRSTLPPISRLDMSHASGLKREEADIQAAEAILSIAPHHSAKNVSPFPGPPPPPYSVSPPRHSHASPSHAGRPVLANDKDQRPDVAPMRQSLPSLSEIVGRTEPHPPFERERTPPRSYLRRSASPRASRYAHEPDKSRTSHRHSLSDNREASPRHRHAPRPAYGPVTNTSPPSPRPQSYGQWSMPPPPPPPPTTTSATSQPQYAPRSTEVSPTWPSSTSPAQSATSQSPSFSAQPYYAQQSDDLRAQANRSAPYVTSYPTIATSAMSGPPERPWPEGKSQYADGNRKVHGNYSDSVKSQLDELDMEASLDEVYNYSHTLMQFCQTYKTQVPRAQRAGSLPGSEPSTGAVHEAIRYNQQIQDALSSILRRLEAQEAERAKQSAQEAIEKQKASQKAAEEQTTMPSAPVDRRNSTNGTEGKKRRGRAAPPGRCHSCNRAETPEWRRGPDGARTLCNACGLHYAKLTRRYGANKAANGSSSLRQKPMND